LALHFAFIAARHANSLGFSQSFQENRLRTVEDGLELIYCEYHRSKHDALRREMYLKSTPGRKALKLMLRAALAPESGRP